MSPGVAPVPTEIPLLGGELSGGEAIVIESFHDLAAIQSVCATTPNLGFLWETLRVRELRSSFKSLRGDWAENAERYRNDIQERVADGDIDELSAVDQLRLALDIAENIWSLEDPGESGERESLALILAVAEPGSELELASEEPALILTSGSIVALLARGGMRSLTLGMWLVALARGHGAAAGTIAMRLVEALRSSRFAKIPPRDLALLGLPRLDDAGTPDGGVEDKKGIVVFIHGLLSTDIGTFDGFLRELAARHPEIREHSLFFGWPHDTLTGIDNNAYQLAVRIHDSIGVSGPKIVFVCHSRGGLVARATANRLYKIDARYRQTLKGCVTFGTPHEGAELAQVPSHEFLAYYVAVAAASGTRNLARLSDVLLYVKQQPDGAIQGVVDLRLPDGDGFIAELRDEEINDGGKQQGRARELRLLAVGGQYQGPKSTAVALARRFFGKGVAHDLVVGLHSSASPSADLRLKMECSHSAYCSEAMRGSPGLLAAVEQVADWL